MTRQEGNTPPRRGAAAVPRPAATIVVLRDGAAGPEVLLQQRHGGGDFAGAWVFPGGLVSEADRDPALSACSVGLTPERAERVGASGRLAFAFWAAALRECFEESGVLIGGRRDATGAVVPLSAADHRRLAPWRRRLDSGEATLLEFCRGNDLVMDFSAMCYFSFWTTPRFRPRRYATRFFACRVAATVSGTADGREAVAHRWLAPAEALRLGEEGELVLHPPTVAQLTTLSGGATAAAIVERLREREHLGVAEVLPRLEERDGRRRLVIGERSAGEGADV
ncbi:MAG: NUDIX domain-containing protein [Pseudomonadota bacterium]